MLKRSIRLLLFGVLLHSAACFSGFSQDFDDYQLLQSGTKVPPALQFTLTERIEAQEKREGKELDRRQEQLDQKRFFIGNNYMTDQLFRSGLVYFGDPVGEYLNRIKDYLLRDDEINRDRITVYLVRSSEVNAFATADGDIFVHLGLMARVPDEATLAFVLCHEIQHVIQRHSFRQFEENQQIKKNLGKNKRKYKEEDLEQFLKAKNLYSRKQELEADDLGLQLFFKSSYFSGGIFEAMDLLKFSYLPIAEMDWDTNYFRLSEMHYPASYYLDSLIPIEVDENEIDEMKTHPNVATRREALELALQAGMNEGHEIGTLSVMFGAEQFQVAREICRFELCHSQLASGEMADAIWTAAVLQKDHPKSIFLEQCMGQALYRLSRFSIAGKRNNAVRQAREVQGSSGKLHHFLHEIEEFELVVLALKFNWSLHQKHPADKTFQLLCEDLARSIVESYPFALKKMKGIPSSLLALLPEEKKKSSPKKSFYFLATEENTWKHDQKVAAYMEPVLKSEFAHAAFVELLEKAAEKYAIPKQVEEGIPKHGTDRLLAGYALGSDRVVYSPLTYRYVDFRKDIPFQYRASDEILSNYMSIMDEMGKRLDLGVVVLDFSSEEQENLEDIAILRRWLMDAGSGVEAKGMVNLYQADALLLAEKYGTNLFAWNSVYQYRDFIPLGKKIGGLLFSIPFFVFMPFAIHYAFSPIHNTKYTNVVFDITTGEALMVEQRTIRKNPRERLLKSTVYNSLYQIKKQPLR